MQAMGLSTQEVVVQNRAKPPLVEHFCFYELRWDGELGIDVFRGAW